jgi:hypothetical protein
MKKKEEEEEDQRKRGRGYTDIILETIVEEELNNIYRRTESAEGRAGNGGGDELMEKSDERWNQRWKQKAQKRNTKTQRKRTREREGS